MTFGFGQNPCFWFLFHFAPHSGLSLNFIYKVKVFQKMLKKVKWFEDQICQSNLIGFSGVNLARNS